MKQEDMPAPQKNYDQLGGKRFMLMVGATNLIKVNSTLSFNVKRNTKGITHVHIILDMHALYDVEFLKVRNCGTETLSESYKVCPDELRKIITEGTGLEIH